MKSKVTEWLKNGCSWEHGLFLLPATGFLEHFHRTCKIQGATESNKRMLQYQLCKVAGITEKEARNIKIEPRQLSDQVSTEDSQINTEVEPIETIVKAKNDQRLKLRDQFPFLSSPDCPNELKILTGDKITAYYNYCAAHAKLPTSSSEGELLQNNKDVVENWLNNRLIFAEFEYYGQHKKMLMKHPIFKSMKREEKIVSMKVPELIKLLDKLKMNIWRNAKLIKEEPGSDLTNERLERIKTYEFELKIVLRLLDAK